MTYLGQKLRQGSLMYQSYVIQDIKIDDYVRKYLVLFFWWVSRKDLIFFSNS